MDYIIIGIILLQLIAYVIVTVIQRVQINRLKETISGMESFHKIFNVQEVRDYVQLMDDTTKMKYDKMINELKKQSFKNIAKLIDRYIDATHCITYFVIKYKDTKILDYLYPQTKSLIHLLIKNLPDNTRKEANG